jgi:peptidoglycan/xylan/chitin deacetylase (PgdA/CDA1 family)
MNQRVRLDRRRFLQAGVALGGMLLVSCGKGGDGGPTATRGAGNAATTTGTTGQPAGATLVPGTATTAGPTSTQPPGTEPAATPPATDPAAPTSAGPVELTAEQLQQFKPNELGGVPILEYHQLGSPPEQFMREPDQFRNDLQWLYDHNFHVVSLRSFLDETMDVPAGKRPVILSFDDSPVNQFRLTPLDNGQYAADPNCAIGILETFFGAHPDFGRGGVFAILPQQLFNWPSEPEQNDYGAVKVTWMIANGYELANHSYDHVDLSTLTPDQVAYELCAWNDWVQTIAPGVQVDAVTLPYGMYPSGGDDTAIRGSDYNGQHYSWRCALEIGANPATSPISTQYDPYALARIQAFDDELNKWFGMFESDPGILYVSDGNPNTVTVPNDLHPWLVDTLDESKIGNRKLVRY